MGGKKGKAGWGQEEDKGKNKVSLKRGEGYKSITGAASLFQLEDCRFLMPIWRYWKTCVPTGQTAWRDAYYCFILEKHIITFWASLFFPEVAPLSFAHFFSPCKDANVFRPFPLAEVVLRPTTSHTFNPFVKLSRQTPERWGCAEGEG